MTELTKEIIAQIIEEMRSGQVVCIECGGQYFHAPLCRRGFGLDGEELVQRLKGLAAKIQQREQSHPSCRRCGRPAEGTFWEAYHGFTAIVSVTACCEVCSNELHPEDQTRPSGFLPGVVTSDPFEVQRLLNLNQIRSKTTSIRC